jgi:hypothetical protein
LKRILFKKSLPCTERHQEIHGGEGRECMKRILKIFEKEPPRTESSK